MYSCYPTPPHSCISLKKNDNHSNSTIPKNRIKYTSEKIFKKAITIIALFFCVIASFMLAPFARVTQTMIDNVFGTSLSWSIEAYAETGYVETDAWATNKVYYDSTHRMYTTWFHIDGHLAYCCEPANGTPKSASYYKNYWNNRIAAAILYFGYGGPGFNYARNNGYWPSHNSDGGAMSDGDYYVATHVLISKAYGSDYKHAMSASYRKYTDNTLTGWVLTNLQNNAWRVPEKFVQNVYYMDPGNNTKNGLLGQDIISYNWVDAGGIQINKKEAKTNRNMSNIDFGVYNSNKNGDWGTKVTTIKTDGSGNASTRENELPTGWYRLREENPPSGYTAIASDAINVTDNFSYAHTTAKNGTVSGKTSNRIQLYNTATVDISATKTWLGKDVPKNTKITLNRNGLPYNTVTIDQNSGSGSNANNWNYTWSKLPKYDDSGNAYKYTVIETDAKNGKITINGNDYTVSYKTSGNNTTITNNEVKGITVDKRWIDSNNRYDTRPSSITATLQRYDSTTRTRTDIETVTLNDSNNWHYSWDNLSTANSGNGEYLYSVVENMPSPANTLYSSSRADTSSTQIVFVNTLNLRDITVNKEWVGTKARPSGIVVRLKNSSGEIVRTATITPDSSGKWSYTFTNVPTYNASGLIEDYSVSEDPVSGYSNSIITGDATNGFTIKNVSNEKRSISVVKQWVNNTGHEDTKPDSVTIELYKNGNRTNQTLTLYASNNWVGSFTNLDKYDSNGDLINYTIAERQVEGYSWKVTGSQDSGFTVTNTYGVTTVTVYKYWDNTGNVLPSNVTVTFYLYADGVKGNRFNLSWKNGSASPRNISFPNLPKYNASGAEIKYTIVEDPGALYASDITRLPTSQFPPNTFECTNKYSEDKTYAVLEKIWDDDDNKRKLRPSSVQFDLNQRIYSGNSSELQARYKKSQNNSVINTAPYKKNTNVRYLVGNGGKLVSFMYTNNKSTTETINIYQSIDRNENISTIGGDSTASSDTLYQGERIAGSFKAPTGTHLYRVLLTSGINDEQFSADNKKLSVFYCLRNSSGDILNDNVTRFCTYLSTTSETTSKFGDVTLSEDNNWGYANNNLPRFASDDSIITYSFSEHIPIYYRMDMHVSNNLASDVNTALVDGTYCIVTNKVGEYEDIPVKKVWDDNNNALGYRPTKITVSLYNLTTGTNTGQTITLTAENNWEGVFTNVYKGGNAQYSVRETTVPYYSSEFPENDGGLNADGSITLTNTLQTVDIPVTKIWNDGDNEIGTRPSQVVMRLSYMNGSTKIDTGKRLVLNDKNSWTSAFTDLPAIQSGTTRYTYVVDEEPVDGYTSSSAWRLLSNGSRSYTFTNKINTRDINVKKVWNVASKERSEIPSDIVVTLFADGAITRTITLNAGNNWTYTVKNLPFYSSSGTKINYTIQESMYSEDRDKYVTSVSGNASDGFVITNSRKINIPVTKIWNDDDNHDGIRPDNVSVFLLKNGVNTGQAVLLDETNNWTDSFKNLDAVDDEGNDIVYTIDEEYVDGYSKQFSGDTTSGFTITNTHENTTTDLKIVKGWDDQNDIDGKRPNRISLGVYRDGAYYRSVTLLPGNNWEAALTRIPKTSSSTGRDIVYTVSESSIDGYVLSQNELTGNANDGWTITLVNHHEPEKMNIPIRKRWYNTEGQVLPSDITVTLMQDGKDYKSIKMTSAGAINGEWVGEFTDIPIYKDNTSEKYDYSVKESTVNGDTSYACQVGGDVNNGFVLTNIYTKASTQIVGVKQWVGDTPEDRPASITVRLLRDDVVIDSQVVKAQDGDSWRFMFADLPASSETGELYNYTIEEDPVPGYYAEYGFLPNSETYRITNKRMLDIPVMKKWDDNDNANGSRPKSVTARLCAYRYTNSSTLMAGSDGYYPFTANASGNEFTGTLICDGNVQTATINIYDENNNRLSRWTVDIDGDTSPHSFSLGKIGPDARKIIVYDEHGANASSHVLSFKVHDTMRTKEVFDSCELNDAGHWTKTFTDMPATDNKGFELDYFVEEDPVYGYTTLISGDIDNGFTITNTEQTEIKVTKKWLSNNDGYTTKGTPSSTIVTLLQNGREYQSLTLNRADGYVGTFKNMPWIDSDGNEYKYEVTEGRVHGWQLLDVSGNTTDGFVVTNGMTTNITVQKEWNNDTEALRPSSINATLVKKITILKDYSDKNINNLDDAVNDYALRLNNEIDKNGLPSNIKATVTVDSLSNTTSVIVKLVDDSNKILYEKRQELSIGDNVFDISTANINSGTSGLRVVIGNISDTDTTISDLYASGTLRTSLETKWVVDADNIVLTANDLWWYQLSGLPLVDMNGATYEYDIREDSIPNGYSVTYDSQGEGTQSIDLTIKNSYSKINIPVKKVWNDQNNADMARPNNITVELLRNGWATGKTLVLNEENGWSGSFDELDRMSGSWTNTYTVRETDVPSGYVSTVSGNQSNGFVVTNTRAGKTSVTVTKNWNDQNNANRVRPLSVTIHLFADGTEVSSKIIEDDGNGNWQATFDNLDYATSNGQVIKYTVSETSVSGYKLQGIDGSQDDGYVITNWTSSPIKLPETGLSGLFMFLLIGVSTALAAFISRRKAIREQKD